MTRMRNNPMLTYSVRAHTRECVTICSWDYSVGGREEVLWEKKLHAADAVAVHDIGKVVYDVDNSVGLFLICSHVERPGKVELLGQC